MRRVVLIGNFPPRKCGIATFTRDLYQGLLQNKVDVAVIAMNDGLEHYSYPDVVVFEINQNHLASYLDAAYYVNQHQFDAVILQHEFGIFGGKDGSHILQLLKRIKVPIITTLHTILDNPTDSQKEIILELTELSDLLVSMSEKGIQFLNKIYDIPISKLQLIHHGLHEIELNGLKQKKRLKLNNHIVLMTFGLLSRNKSIEVVIDALPQVVKKYDNVKYLVLGATHPHVLKHDGEEYRYMLRSKVNELGLQGHVEFINRYISNDELFEYLSACDIYVIPYSNEKQITSGTLIYAMGAKNAIVSTPFWHAKEILVDNRGKLFDFNNSEQLSQILVELIENPAKRKLLAENAFNFARNLYWPKIARKYLQLIDKILEEGAVREIAIKTGEDLLSDLPSVKLDQLIRLTDETGIIQHARFCIPNRQHGYCLDDNARALRLIVMLQNYSQHTHELHRLIDIYLSFIDYAYNPATKRFRNFMSYDRRWLEDVGSEDSQGRTTWALGYSVSHLKKAIYSHHVSYLFEKALEIVPHLNYPRSIAYAILGLTEYLKVKNDQNVFSLMKSKVDQLSSFFSESINNPHWPWYENIVTYANARIPQALIASGRILNDKSLIQMGVKLIDWLVDKQFQNSVFVPIGNMGWLTPDGISQFDQQPIEAHGMLDACLEAEDYFNNQKYEAIALSVFAWFTGRNFSKQNICDYSTGGCFDGLSNKGVNLNQGAESTLSWMMSLVKLTNYLENKKKR
ncbi:MAG TPA: glycosyltransferase [Bacteroidales bacterium]|nr:glycosyltransferase [Bacteroidales bacterium]